MEWLGIGILAFIFLGLFSIRDSGGVTRYNTNYDTRGALFTPAERSFLGVLDSAVPENIRIFGKVRVADILKPSKGMSRKDWQVAFNKISRKHFDYVLCDVDSLEVIAVVELDDSSHSKTKTKERDRFVESACLSAKLPLIRFKAKRNYNVDEVRAHLEEELSQNDSPVN